MNRRWLLRAVGVLFGLCLLLLGGATYEMFAARGDTRRFGAGGEWYDIGGYSLYIVCAGERQPGTPLIVLESGELGWSYEWGALQAQLSQTRRVCAYDRAGVGFSDASPYPRTGAQIAAELHELLSLSANSGPYLLVAHGSGSMFARSFAQAYPDQVAGLVLIEPRNEFVNIDRVDANALKAVPVLRFTSRIGVIRLFAGPFRHVVEPDYDELPPPYPIPVTYSAQALATFRDEIHAMPETLSDVRSGRLNDVPLIVMTAENSPLHALVDGAWAASHVQVAQLSTNGQHNTVSNSGLYIHIEQPGDVLRAVRDVLVAYDK